MEDLTGMGINLKYNYKVTIEFQIIGTQEYRFIQDPSDNAVLRDLIQQGYIVTIEEIEEEI